MDRGGAGGDAADEGFELGPAAGVGALKLWDGIGKEEGGEDGIIGPGEVGGGGHVAAGKAAVEVVGVGGAGAGQVYVWAEAAWAGGKAEEVFGFEMVADPERNFEGGAMAEDKEGAGGEFLVRAGARGVGEGAVLGEEGGKEKEEEEESGEFGERHQTIYRLE